jgi:predicted protein tyrosine phosphatase
MPSFTVCSKSEVSRTVKEVEATHLVTLLDPEDRVRRPSLIEPTNHLRLSFFDEEDPAAFKPPTRWHAIAIMDFGSRLPPDARVVVHCFAGVCRSTAAGLALWLQAHGWERLEEAGKWLKAHRPRACPNMLMAQHFDEIQELDGKFVQLCDQIGADSIARLWK